MAGTSYTRQSTLTDGDTITASLFNTEYNQLVSAFAYASSGTTGHQHDGGAGEGGNIHTIGDQDFNNKIVVDSTNNRWSVYVEVGGSAVEQVRIEDGVVYPVTDSDVDLGTNALRFKDAYIDSLTATGNLTIGGNIDVDGIVEFDGLSGTGSVTVTDILDQDDMSGNSATALATQQSIKAYVDSQVTAQDLDLTDGSSSISIDLDSEALSVLGGTGIDSTASGNGVTLAIDSTVTTLTGSQTLTNKTLTSPDVNTPDIDGGTIDGAVIGGSSAAAGSFTTVGATGNITVGGTVDGRDVATDGSKLDGIEASATADQTNAEIRTAVEAATDSNVFTDADHSKLNAIEASATADQTNAEIRAAVEAATDSNVFTDADHTKLNAIEASADITDTANVTAAGALMDSELTAIASVKALNQGVATTDSPTFAAVTVNGNVEFDGLSGTGSVTVTDILDQDDMSGNSATALATQQSIKAYVDAQQDTVDTLAEILALSNATGGSNIVFGDSSGATDDRLVFGAGSDLEIYHSGSHSIINETGTGELKIQATNLRLQSASGGENYLTADLDGAVRIYNDDAQKFQTTATGITVTGEVAATSLDISGDIDVDGTTNLDVVDIDGAVDMASTLTVGGNITQGNGDYLYTGGGNFDIKHTVAGQNIVFSTTPSGGSTAETLRITSDGKLSKITGDLTLDVAGDIILDAGGSDVIFKHGGASRGHLKGGTSAQFELKSLENNADFVIKGVDNNAEITALTLDMSDEGAAIFNGHGTFNDTVAINSTSSGALLIAGSGGGINFTGGNNRVLFNSNRALEGTTDGATLTVGEGFTTINIDGAATFSSTIAAGAATFTTADNNAQLTLISTDADANAGPILVLDRQSASPADSDVLGQIQFNGKNDAAEAHGYAKIEARIVDASNATEDGRLELMTSVATEEGISRILMNATETVINDNSKDLDFRVESNGNANMLFVDGGNNHVNVGTATDLAGVLNVDGNISLSGAGTGGRSILLGGETGSYEGILRMQAGGISSAFGGGIALYGHSHASKAGDVVLGISGGSGGSFRVNSDGVDTGTDRLEVTDTGAFTTTPSAGNHAVFNEGGVDADFRVESNNNANMLFVDGGNNKVGVGTAAPAELLELERASGDTFIRFDKSDAFKGLIGIADSSASGSSGSVQGDMILRGQTNVLLDTAGTTRFKIAADGSLSTPTAGTSNVRFGVNAGNSITSGGNYNVVVGDEAGTAITTGDLMTAVGYKALFTEDTGERSTAVGAFALTAQNAAVENYNTAVGYAAGNQVTTGVQNTLVGGLAGDALTTGGENVALGYLALSSDTTGQRSVAIGRAALFAQNLSGGALSYNTAIGYNAGTAVTTGVQNTLIGGLAGDATTTASNNTAVGYQALTDNTTGGDNTALGFTALDANTTGASNVSLGSYSLSANTTGGTNVAVGDASLFSNTTASNNVAVGKDSLRANTTASNNTAVGYQSLRANTTGTGNAAFGANSLLQNTTGSGNSAFGSYHAGVQYAPLRNNTTGGGNSAFGVGALQSNTTADNNSAFGVNALATNTTGGSNTALGHSALGNNTTGTRNTAIGRTALQSNTTASDNTSAGYFSMYRNTTGQLNTAFGKDALEENTTGSNNVALGYKTLEANTTASNNTAVGYLSLTANTTGTQNVAVGANALDANTTGENNTALGWGALTASTTSSGNTAVGSIALYLNTTGSGNTAMGQESLRYNTTGVNNVALGYQALVANTTASYNTAVGATALDANTTGSSNTGLGSRALSSNTTGNHNTAVGEGAMVTTTTGADNTAVGTGALLSNTTASNNTAVGKSALSANTTGANNTAIGGSALDANTTGGYNIAIGYNALTAATTANSNTAIGESAMLSTTTGADSVAVGKNALLANTTGANNVAVGVLSLDANTTGVSNVALGHNALTSNTTASNNTAVGSNSLAVNSTGVSNVAVGQNALALATHSTNTAIGYNAGGAITSGQANLCVGINAGDYQATLTTGTGNVLVGPYCDAVSATANDQHCFGYNLDAESGYTTLGSGGSDIRAAFGNVTWATVSDERYKKDIADSTAGLSFINALQPRTFKYKNLGELPETFSAYEADSTEVFKNSDTNHGFIAQEVKAAIDADSSIKDGFRLWDARDDGSQEVAEAALIPVLTKAIQELSAQVDALTARIETLEG